MLHVFETPTPAACAVGLETPKPTAPDVASALAALFEAGTSAIVLLDLRTDGFERVNARFCELLNYDAATLMTMRLSDVQHPEDRAHLGPTFRQAMRSAGRWEGEIRHLRSDGAVLWLNAGVTVWRRDERGVPTHAISVLHDVTQRRAVIERLRISEDMLKLGQRIGRIATLSRDMRADCVTFGPMSREMLGLPESEAAMPFDDFLKLVHPDDVAGLKRSNLEVVARHDAELAAEFRIVRPTDKAVRDIDLRVAYRYDGTGLPVASIGVGIDVTERKASEQRFEFAARHDALTGLPNRAYFRDRLDEACARTTRDEFIAVLFLDLDRFKDVNDTLGHPAGDQLLVQVGKRLQTLLRATDTVARLGGDEFAVIQRGLQEPEDAARLARRLVDKLRQPFLLDGNRVTIGASVGIGVSPRDGVKAEELMKAADLALYEAKAQPNKGWRFFEPQMNAQAQVRYELEADLRRAIQEEEFELFYQPMLDADALRVQKFEALIHWRHPKKGLLAPESFIPACEQNGMICEIGDWALRRACVDAASWPAGIGVAVNVTAVEVNDSQLDVSVAAALAQSGLAPERLELEIAESALSHDSEAIFSTLLRVKALGGRIALDDFGGGRASLGYLQTFPFDRVKIDRSFTAQIDASPRGATVVRAMLDLCGAFELVTTVGGVETQAQFAKLGFTRGMKVQGALFSPPRPVGDVPDLIAQFCGGSGRRLAAE